MELPEDFFDNYQPDRTKLSNTDSFPDLNATWLRATWSYKDFKIDWARYEGMSATEACSQFIFVTVS